MTHGTRRPLRFSGRRGRRVEAGFQGGSITGNGGVMLVSEQERRLGLTTRIARLLDDPRRQASCRHSKLHLLRQRLHALCLGHEDLNDHDELRHDAALQTAVDRDTPLASASTLCRFEAQAERSRMVSIHEVLVELFIESFREAPEELIPDFDATDGCMATRRGEPSTDITAVTVCGSSGRRCGSSSGATVASVGVVSRAGASVMG